MPTRATILIKSDKVKIRIYHHHDGYPEGIGKDIKSYLKSKKHWYPDEIANDLIKGKVAGDDNYELTTCQHGDENYAYLIDCNDATLKCFRVGFDDYDYNWTDDKLVDIP